MAYGNRERRVADRVIRKYGQRCLLRSDAGDRECQACEVRRDTGRGRGQVSNPTQRRFLISAVLLDGEPDHKSEELVLLDPVTGDEVETLVIAAPADKLSTSGIVIYWRILIDG